MLTVLNLINVDSVSEELKFTFNFNEKFKQPHVASGYLPGQCRYRPFLTIHGMDRNYFHMTNEENEAMQRFEEIGFGEGFTKE